MRMLLLGFSAGIPYLLVFGTFSLLLKDAGVSRSEIGFVSWIGLTYSIKVLWSPVVDNLKLPIIGNLFGKRKSWLLVTQLGIIACLVGISVSEVSPENYATVVWFAFFTAFLAATQDIVIDAFRIESNDDKKQGAAAATYIMGYRMAMIVTGAGALVLAEHYSWETSYQIMALCMGVGLLGWLLSPEPEHKFEPLGESKLEKRISNKFVSLFSDQATQQRIQNNKGFQYFVKAILSPFVDFFTRYKWWAFAIIAFILTYRISDIVMGTMANVFYDDMGFTKSEIAAVSKVYGLLMTIIGAFVGGYVVNKVKILNALMWGIILVIATNLLFAYMSTQPKDLNFLVAVISADNLAGGFSMGVLLSYMAMLVNKDFTATQYALFSSLMTLTGKFVGGFSGVNIDNWGYPIFFTYSAFLGVPAMILIFLLMYREKKLQKQETKKAE
ncbi:MAG: MFS transporter [Gammaproteobacteria bacterium]|nr:MFS transporter [Gammaproteobacteria bacterium]